MKKTNYYVLSLLMAAGLAACSAEIDSTQQQGDQVPLQLTATKLVDNAEVQESHARRAANNLYVSSFDGGESVKVWLNNTETSDNYTINSTDQATLEGGSLYYPAGSTGTATVFALYPSASTSSHTVAYDQSGDAAYKLSDLMYATKTVNLSEKTSSQALQFSHQLVKLHVHIVKGSGVTSITSVKMKNVKRTVSVTPATTTCTIGSATSAGDGQGDEIIIFSGEGTAATQDYACVFPIQAWSDQDFIEITADDQTATYKLTRDTWTKGNSYTLTLNVNTATLGTTTSITGWNEGASATIGGGGDFTIANISAVTYDGTAKTPTPTVSYNDITLTLNDDYTLEYAGNTNAGKAAVIAIGKGSYVGKVGVKEFTINKADNDITLTPATLSIAPGATGSFTVTRSGDGAVSASSSNTSVATVSATGTTVTVTHVSVGTADITVNVAASANYNAASKTVSVECISQIAPALGDPYYSDGSWGNNPHASGATVIGVVAWLGSDSDLKCSKSHGLVIAKTDANSGVAWGPTSTDETFLTNVSSIDGCKSNNKNGLTNTASLVGDSHTHGAASAADSYTPAAPTSAGATKWFLPSAAQWIAVLGSNGLGGLSDGTFAWASWFDTSQSSFNAINTALTKTGVGGTALTNKALYWSSSEYSTDRAVGVGFDSSYGVAVDKYIKSSTYRVRAFLAF